jgi:hypothetical protein
MIVADPNQDIVEEDEPSIVDIPWLIKTSSLQSRLIAKLEAHNFLSIYLSKVFLRPLKRAADNSIILISEVHLAVF